MSQNFNKGKFTNQHHTVLAAQQDELQKINYRNVLSMTTMPNVIATSTANTIDGHFYASQQQQQNAQAAAAAGMALINRSQQIPGQNTFVISSNDISKLQYGQMQFQRPPTMQIPQTPYRLPVYNHHQPRPVAASYMSQSQADFIHMSQAQQYQQYQARGPPPMILQGQQMQMYPAQYYQPAPAIYQTNIQQQVVPRPPQISTPQLTTISAPQTNIQSEPMSMANVMPAPVQAPPQQTVAPAQVIQQQPPVVQQPPPTQAPPPERKRNRLNIIDPTTGRNVLDDIPKAAPAPKQEKRKESYPVPKHLPCSKLVKQFL